MVMAAGLMAMAGCSGEKSGSAKAAAQEIVNSDKCVEEKYGALMDQFFDRIKAKDAKGTAEVLLALSKWEKDLSDAELYNLEAYSRTTMGRDYHDRYESISHSMDEDL